MCSQDDLWNQRTLSTFTTFARTPDASKSQQTSPTSGNGHSLPYKNNNGNSPNSDSSCGTSSASSDGSSAHIHDVVGNGSIGGGSRNGTLTRLNGINKAKPVAVPILLSHQPNNKRPPSQHGHSASLVENTNGSSLNSTPPSSHAHSHSLSYTSSTDSTVEADFNAYVPSELDVSLLTL